MKWTKTKTVIAVCVAVVVGVLIVNGIATVAAKKIEEHKADDYPKLSSTDLSWADDPRYWKPDGRALEKLPPVLILRPMRPSNQKGGVQVDNRFLSRGVTVEKLLAIAYSCYESRMIIPDDLPSDRFDLMLTLSNHPREMLQDEIKKRFGLIAHRETREEDVLILKVINHNAPDIEAPKNSTISWSGSDHETTIKNQPFDGFATFIENQLNIPILNQTDLDKHYDIHINWQTEAGESNDDAFKRALHDQLGLELVPSREPIEMLVVEKTL
jgi:uncharacterized protein (TIGR03435 family)